VGQDSFEPSWLLTSFPRIECITSLLSNRTEYLFIYSECIVMDRREESLRKLGQRLSYLREKQNLTISELAARSGLDLDIIEKIEAGAFNPEISVIVALAGGLGVGVGELVDFL